MDESVLMTDNVGVESHAHNDAISRTVRLLTPRMRFWQGMMREKYVENAQVETKTNHKYIPNFR